MDIQLKRGQFHGAVNNLCAKFRGILQDINVASKLFYSYCCSFYGCQLWDLSIDYIEDIYVAWQKAIRRILNLPYNTHRYLLPFVAGSSHLRVKLVNRFNNFFNALMSSDNKIIELLVYNCHLSNTPLGLNRKFMNMYNCYKCNEVEEAHWALLLSLLKVRCLNWSVPQFQKDEIQCMIYDVCVNWSWYFMVMYLLNVWISTFPCPTVLYEWLIIVIFIFVYINMFIFLCILGSFESE